MLLQRKFSRSSKFFIKILMLFIGTVAFHLISFVPHEIKLTNYEDYENHAFEQLTLRKLASLETKIKSQLINIPWDLLSTHEFEEDEMNSSCGRLPHFLLLHINNVYWQQAETDQSGTFNLYASYFDDRSGSPELDLLVMIDNVLPLPQMYCQIWFEQLKQPVIASVSETRLLWVKEYGNYQNGTEQPYMLICPIPEEKSNEIPIAVSLVQHECDTATNIIKVFHAKSKKDVEKDNFAVCSKGLYLDEKGDDDDENVSVRLIEWIETLKALGAGKVVIYFLSGGENVLRVLDFYHEDGFVDYFRISLPGFQPSLSLMQQLYLKMNLINRWQNEMIHFHDCIYRTMHDFKYVTLLDIDEVIVPRTTSNWHELLRILEADTIETYNTFDSFVFKNVFMTDEMLKRHEMDSETQKLIKDIPLYMHMQRHIFKGPDYSLPGHNIKCFHKARNILQVHHHLPKMCLRGPCKAHDVNPELGHVQHYRKDCYEPMGKACSIYTRHSKLETSLWRIKEPVTKRVTEILNHLGMLNS